MKKLVKDGDGPVKSSPFRTFNLEVQRSALLKLSASYVMKPTYGTGQMPSVFSGENKKAEKLFELRF